MSDFTIYLIAWSVVAVVSNVSVKRAKKIKTKRLIHNITQVIIFSFIVVMAVRGGMPLEGWLIIVPIITLFLFVSYKYTIYCPSCSECYCVPFSKENFCSKCGAKLKEEKNETI